MKIGFSYNLKDFRFDGTDSHAEYETKETIIAVRDVLSRFGEVIHLPCDETVVGRFLQNRPDMVFNIAEGWGGRDRESFVPSLCQMLGIPYTGSDGTALGVSMDKVLTKRIAESVGIRVTRYTVLESAPTDDPSFDYPAFVKPLWDGSSRGIAHNSLVKDFEAYKKKAEEILQEYNQPALVEPYLEGREYCVALVGNDPPELLTNCEILLGHEDGIPFFSHEYKRHNRDRLAMNPDMSETSRKEMESFAITLWKSLRLRDYARFDFRTDRDGTLYFLELNALPGLSPVSGIFVRQALASDYTYDSLIEKIMERTLGEVRL